MSVIDEPPDRVDQPGVVRHPSGSLLFNPFPGLRPFGIEEAHLFFGREGQSEDVLLKLAVNRFVAVLGASGSGKSSLMYCGLVPTLYGGFMSQAGSNWRVVVMRPGGGPIDNLAEALVSNNEYDQLDEEEKLIKKTITATVLRSSSLGLVEAVKQLKSSDDENILILIDQFEELFRYKKTESTVSNLDEASSFVNMIVEAAHQFDEPIYITITMRSDFIGECTVFPELTQMINDSHYLIPQMTREQKRLAVEGPVAVGAGSITSRLVQQLLNDVGDNPDHLPVLQHALMRTWAYWSENRKKGEPMDIRHYNAIGTLKEALSQHANEAYDMLPKREKQLCETIFKALTEKGTENQGIRRPTKLKTIADIAGVSEKDVVKVVNKFREPGKSLLMPPYGKALDNETVIDISHESLMRIWTRLKAWLEEESRSAEMYVKLSESAARYQAGRAGVWKMPDLQLALNWKEENRPTLVWGQRYDIAYERTMVFLEVSKRAYETKQKNKELLQKRRMRRSRVITILLGAAALFCIFLAILARIQATNAVKQEELAKLEMARATKQTELAKENAEIAAQREAEAKKAQADAEEAKEEALNQTNIATKERIAAEAAKKEADVQREVALAAKSDTEKSAEEAERQRIKAVNAQNQATLEKQRALALRYQAIALSMSIKTSQIKDTIQKNLIALQAYKFFKEHGDKPHNGDIYDGLYNAWKTSLGQSIIKYAGHKGSVRSITYSNDGKNMYSAGADGRVLKWDMTSGNRTPIDMLPVANKFINRVIKMSPDGRHLAIGNDANIQIIDTKETSSVKTIEGIRGGVLDLVFLPDGSELIAIGIDGIIRRTNFSEVSPIATPGVKIEKLAISNDGQMLAAGTHNGNILLFDLAHDNLGTVLSPPGAKPSPVTALAFSSNGQYLAFGDLNGKLNIQDIITKTTLAEFNAHESKIADIKFNQANSHVATASWDRTAKIWELKDIYDLPLTLADHDDYVNSISFSPDGQSLATGSFDDFVRVWPTRSDMIAAELCDFVDRNLDEKEWNQYVGSDINYEITCDKYPSGVEK